MTKKILGFYLVTLFFLISLVEGIVLDYYIVIEENGNSVVIITVNGSGLMNIPIEKDVDEIKIQGALYSVNNNSIDVAIGSTEQAVILYKTSMLTKKEGNIWSFNMNLTDYQKNQTIVTMPNNTSIKNTFPKALIESGNFKKLIWADNISEVTIEYYFENNIDDGLIEPKDGEKEFDYKPLILIPVFIASTVMIVYLKNKKVTGIKNKQNIMKTLPDNENKIVEFLIRNGGGMKRSKVEKTTGISKSSLAAALKNLERKKIIELDKTYTTHYIRLTKWFNEL